MSFGWDVDYKHLESYELKYDEILNKLIDLMPIQSQPGASTIINELVTNNDEITVITSLPRTLALKVLKKSQLSLAFEGRVSPANLICRDEINVGKTIYMRSYTLLKEYN